MLMSEYWQFSGTLFTMNAHIKSEECNIKLEDDLVPIGGIKIEPLVSYIVYILKENVLCIISFEN